jgi:hypothetical protein
MFPSASLTILATSLAGSKARPWLLPRIGTANWGPTAVARPLAGSIR